MKILAIGDIVGEKALEKVEKVLPELIKNESIESVSYTHLRAHETR